jgi:hypothetical protein
MKVVQEHYVLKLWAWPNYGKDIWSKEFSKKIDIQKIGNFL